MIGRPACVFGEETRCLLFPKVNDLSRDSRSGFRRSPVSTVAARGGFTVASSGSHEIYIEAKARKNAELGRFSDDALGRP